MQKILIAAILFLYFSPVHAVESVRWNSVSLSYDTVDIDSKNLTGSGISVSQLIRENIFIEGQYRYFYDEINLMGSKVDWEFNALSVGFGYRQALSDNTDFFSLVLLEEIEIESSFKGSSETKTENSYGLNLGIRSLVFEDVELRGSISYLEISDETEITFSASAMYHFTNKFSASIGYSNIDQAEFISLSGLIFF